MGTGSSDDNFNDFDADDGGAATDGRDAQLTAVFGQLLRQNQGRLFAYVHSLVRDLNDADDLFQQTAIILWRKFPEFDRTRSFAAWACGIARLEVSNFLRTRGRSKLYFGDALNLALIEAQVQVEAEDGDAERLRDALTGCLSKLRQRDRELVEECYGGDQSITGVAARRGRSSHSVHNTLRRLRRALYECVRRSLAQQGHPQVSG